MMREKMRRPPKSEVESEVVTACGKQPGFDSAVVIEHLGL